jgi:hypothetical protein
MLLFINEAAVSFREKLLKSLQTDVGITPRRSKTTHIFRDF